MSKMGYKEYKNRFAILLTPMLHLSDMTFRSDAFYMRCVCTVLMVSMSPQLIVEPKQKKRNL